MFGAKITAIEDGTLKRKGWIVWDEKHKQYVVVCKTKEKEKYWKDWFLEVIKTDNHVKKDISKLKNIGNGISLLRIIHIQRSRTYFQFGIHNSINEGFEPEVPEEKFKNGTTITLEEIRNV